MQATPRHSKYPVPLWSIALCGILMGGVMALDSRAVAQSPITKGTSTPAPTKSDNAPTTPAQTTPQKMSKAPVVTPQITAKKEPVATPVSLPKHSPSLGDTLGAGKKDKAFSLKNILVLCLFAGLAGGAMFFAKKRQGGSPMGRGRGRERSMSLIETLRLAGRHQVALIRVQNRILVVGNHEKGLSLLAQLPDNEAIAEGAAIEAQPQIQSPAINPEPIGRPIPGVLDDDRLVRDESDAFFNHVMDRLATAGSYPQEPAPQAEYSPLKRRLERYQLGPHAS